MKRLETKTSDGIFAITLNRPEKRNAIDMLMVDELSESLEHADLSADVRAVAIRGNGKDFCAGADLRELLESVDLPSEDNTRNAMRLGNIFLKIRELAKPVVAVVHGRALAGGCGLATACDIVLAHSDAQFGYPEIRRGFVPAMVMVMLRRAVGEKVAFEHAGLDWERHIEFDQAMMRPAEVDHLVGDASRAREKLGWEPTVGFQEMICRMVDADVRRLEISAS